MSINRPRCDWFPSRPTASDIYVYSRHLVLTGCHCSKRQEVSIWRIYSSHRCHYIARDDILLTGCQSTNGLEIFSPRIYFSHVATIIRHNSCSYISTTLGVTAFANQDYTASDQCVYSRHLVLTGCHCSKRLDISIRPFDASIVLTACQCSTEWVSLSRLYPINPSCDWFGSQWGLHQANDVSTSNSLLMYQVTRNVLSPLTGCHGITS